MMIIHRCGYCSLPDYFPHSDHSMNPMPSELVPTFDKNGQKITKVHEPGTILPFSPAQRVRLCACGECRALYEQVTA